MIGGQWSVGREAGKWVGQFKIVASLLIYKKYSTQMFTLPSPWITDHRSPFPTPPSTAEWLSRRCVGRVRRPSGSGCDFGGPGGW